jgi:hypothetical protein
MLIKGFIMKLKLLSIAFGVVALTAAAAASAHVSVDIGVGVSPCGYPGIYQDCGYYDPPPTIYLGNEKEQKHKFNKKNFIIVKTIK